MPSTKRKHESAGWWRFTSYEIVGGRVVPAPGAQLVAYDPWAHVAMRSRDDEEPAPYLALFQAVAECRGPVSQWSEEATADLLRWVGRFGLLGLLLGEMLALRTSPAGEKAEPRLMFRGADGWHEIASNVDRPARVLLAASRSPPRYVRPSRVLPPYFPRVPPRRADVHAYPLPFSAEFWAQYAEPALEMVRVARELETVVRALERTRETFKRSAERDEALAVLNAYAEPCRPVFRVTRSGSYAPSWVAGTLASALARMALHDLGGIDNVHLFACARCEALFRSRRDNAKYCSVRCQATEEKRRLRAAARKRKRPRSPR